MSENPFEGAAQMSSWFADYRRQLRMRVPSLAMVLSAYEHDEIDTDELERLVEAALSETAVEIPERMAQLRLAPTDAPGAVIEYRPLG